MPLSMELKWLSTFKLIFGWANHWFQNFTKSNTYHSNKTHWVKLLNCPSSHNWRSCWTTDKVREGPRIAGQLLWPALGHKDMADLAATGRAAKQQHCCPQADLLQWQAAFCIAYKRQCLALARVKMRCPHSIHRHEVSFNRADSKPQSIVSEFLYALETSFKIW